MTLGELSEDAVTSREEVKVMGGGFIGIDVSKGQLDVAFRPEGVHLQVSNDPRGIARLVRMLERSQPAIVVLETSGGYEALLFERLSAKQIPVALLNPRHVRQFARASGRMAKTDAIDAVVLAHFAEVMKPEPRRLADEETRKLRILVGRRYQLIQMMTSDLIGRAVRWPHYAKVLPQRSVASKSRSPTSTSRCWR